MYGMEIEEFFKQMFGMSSKEVAKTTATQYEDSYFTATGERWFKTFEHTFEEVSSQIHYSSSCSPFMKDVVWDAWGVDMTDTSAWTAAQMAKAKEYSYWSYVPTKKESDAEKEKIKKEFFDTLQQEYQSLSFS